MKITLVAYRPNNDAVHMGCVTESYDSDFKMKSVTFDQRSLVTDIVAELIQENSNLQDQEPEWDIHILLGGSPLAECLPSDVEKYDISLTVSMRALEARTFAEARKALAAQEEAYQKAREKENQKQLETFFAQAKTLGYEVVPTKEVL